MIDYSKWDNFTDSSDDSDTNSNNKYPQVTKYDKPVRVCLGPQNKNNEITIVEMESSPDKKEKITIYESEYFDVRKHSLNGGITHKYTWSQSSNDIEMNIFVDQSIISSRLDINITSDSSTDNNYKGYLPDNEGRPSGHKLLITYKSTEDNIVTIIENSFPHSVLLDDEKFFWEIKTYKAVKNIPSECPYDFLRVSSTEPLKTIFISLVKNYPICNATLWWNCLFLGDLTIDVNTIEGRNNLVSTEKRESFMQAWTDAHKDFTERVKHTKPFLLDFDEKNIDNNNEVNINNQENDSIM